MLRAVLLTQLGSLFVGLTILYILIKEPILHLAVIRQPTSADARDDLKQFGAMGTWLHTIQLFLFCLSFVLLIFVLW